MSSTVRWLISGSPALLGAVLATGSFAVAIAPPAAAAGTSEIKLVSTLDEPRGYCIDMSGSKESASPTSPLQTHTCYDYQGAIAVDQGVTTSGIAKGVLRFPHFGVCVVGTQVRAGGSVTLAPCSEAGTKAIAMSKAGLIKPIASKALCLTAGATSNPGGGGSPVHLKRSLTWETCSGAAASRQVWRVQS